MGYFFKNFLLLLYFVFFVGIIIFFFGDFMNHFMKFVTFFILWNII